MAFVWGVPDWFSLRVLRAAGQQNPHLHLRPLDEGRVVHEHLQVC